MCRWWIFNCINKEANSNISVGLLLELLRLGRSIPVSINLTTAADRNEHLGWWGRMRADYRRLMVRGRCSFQFVGKGAAPDHRWSSNPHLQKNKVQTSDNKKMHDLREEYGNQMDYERI
jgi:hypothetical protein